MTVDEFLVWDADDLTGRRWQLIDGEPVLMAPAAEPHGAIQNELGRLFANHLATVQALAVSLPRPASCHVCAPTKTFGCRTSA